MGLPEPTWVSTKRRFSGFLVSLGKLAIPWIEGIEAPARQLEHSCDLGGYRIGKEALLMRLVVKLFKLFS